MSEGNAPQARRLRPALIAAGLATIAMMAFPFICTENGGCRFAIVTPWTAISWAGRGGIAVFVVAGTSLLLQGLGLRILARLAGLAVVPLFAVLLNTVAFGLREPACGATIGLVRYLAEVAPYPACAAWPTLAAAWIDCFFIGFALEILRETWLPPAPRAFLKRYTQGILLLSLAPLIALMLLLLVPTVGSEIVKSQWARWREDREANP